MKTSKIPVFEIFGVSVSSREQADTLYDHIRNCSEHAVVDFSGVIFISRSFADQFYKGFLKLSKVMFVEVANGNQVVSDMLNAVIHTQKGIYRDRIPYKMQSFASKLELEKYFRGID